LNVAYGIGGESHVLKLSPKRGSPEYTFRNVNVGTGTMDESLFRKKSGQ
jgi:hypothetical protein